MKKSALVWVRRDLRLHDHAALSAAVRENENTHLVFVFDPHILDPLKAKTTTDFRLHFIADSLLEMVRGLQKQGAGIHVLYGDPTIKIPELAQALGAQTLYFNRDYEPYARQRDKTVETVLTSKGITVKTFKDHVIFEPDEVLNNTGSPYKVFTPYSKAWVLKLGGVSAISSHPVPQVKNNAVTQFDTVESILKFIGFSPCPAILKGGSQAGFAHLKAFAARMSSYAKTRDYPAVEGVSQLSVYIRHGCISVRDMVNLALQNPSSGAECWLNELIWREFYQMVAYHFPHVSREAFNPKYKHLNYPGGLELLQAWQEGRTGFPIVDAAMRCLNQTGWMHNRLRMVVASFLCKTALVDWRFGEAYFAQKLLDYDFAANNGGWQWASSTGCDAAPYFRIFNPYSQSQKFDAEGRFIKAYCPELAGFSAKEIHCPEKAKYPPYGFRLGVTYPLPMVDYAAKRQEALALYQLV